MFGVDYAFSPHPTPAELKAAGVRFVIRYCSPLPANDHNGKNLLPAEKTAILDAGMSLVLVFESTAQRMLGGKTAGTADAEHADAVCKALGMPGLPVFFAADWDATPAQQVPVNAYLDGAAAVIGLSRAGLYSGFYPMKRAFDARKITWGFQTLAWSSFKDPKTGKISTLWDPRAQIHQALGIRIGAGSCDVDSSVATDFGQWPRPARPKPAPAPAPAHPAVRRVAGPTGQSWLQIAAERHADAENLFHLTTASLTATDLAVNLAMPLANGQIYYTEN